MHRLAATIWLVMFGLTLGACTSGADSASSGETSSSLTSAQRERVARGLAISPVPIDTKKMRPDEVTQLGWGSYIVNAAGACNDCHGGTAGFLAGGNPFALDNAGHVVWARNLTPDPETGMTLSRFEFFAAMQSGRDFHPDQHVGLVVMPWEFYRWLSEQDLDAVYAYLREVPAVNNPVPADTKNDLPIPVAVRFPHFYNDGTVDRPLVDDWSDLNAIRGRFIDPNPTPRGMRGDVLAQYGRGSYLVNAMIGCGDCHTNPSRAGSKINVPDFLSGGRVFPVPPPLVPVFHQVRSMSANLKGAVNGFFVEPDATFALFSEIIHTGTHADESPPRPLGWPMVDIAGFMSNLVDDDLEDVYVYVKNTPTVSGAADKVTQSYARACQTAADCSSGESCDATTNECVGRACVADTDCDTCQTCNLGACVAPAPTSLCLTNGI